MHMCATVVLSGSYPICAGFLDAFATSNGIHTSHDPDAVAKQLIHLESTHVLRNSSLAGLVDIISLLLVYLSIIACSLNTRYFILLPDHRISCTTPLHNTTPLRTQCYIDPRKTNNPTASGG